MIRNSAVEMAAALAAGETTSVELTQAHLDQIAAVDKAVHAFLYVDTEGALAQASTIDKARAAGEALTARRCPTCSERCFYAKGNS
jgi:aspartyl-tRNA(Asn)/glutamyl-tRNA(Gln) amidotransferase subunit A